MKKAFLTLILLLVTTTTYAHHPLGGQPLQTFGHGLLSGIGHPVLGFDHLLFVVLVGIVSFLGNYRFTNPLAYILAMLTGCLMAMSGPGLPAAEIVIGLSLLVVGSIVLAGKAITFPSSLLLFALFGLFHGAGFGQAIAGQEGGLGNAVQAGYLLGLGAIQYLVAITAGWLVVDLHSGTSPVALKPRLAAAMVAGAGLLLTFENIEGSLISVLTG